MCIYTIFVFIVLGQPHGAFLFFLGCVSRVCLCAVFLCTHTFEFLDIRYYLLASLFASMYSLGLIWYLGRWCLFLSLKIRNVHVLSSTFCMCAHKPVLAFIWWEVRQFFSILQEVRVCVSNHLLLLKQIKKKYLFDFASTAVQPPNQTHDMFINVLLRLVGNCKSNEIYL